MAAVKAPKRNRHPSPHSPGLSPSPPRRSACAVTGSTAEAAALPTPDHVVVVVLENHAYSQVIGSSSAPYINNTLKAGGADLTQSYGLTPQ
jgi:hypothetical protein